MQAIRRPLQKQLFDYFLVLDFEATCDLKPKTTNPQEIIEFPCLAISARTFTIENTFHRFVRPIHNKNLTHFCSELTGIVQQMVDDSDPLTVVSEEFESWMSANIFRTKKSFIFATCGNWDLMTMLPSNFKLLGLPIPEYFKTWINIKESFLNHTGTYAHGLTQMCRFLDLKPYGRLHSGIDDCKNIVAIMKELSDRGCLFTQSKACVQ
ncbi:hypothetical protein ACOME3_003383 [Neoechinorhynchus agilis]